MDKNKKKTLMKINPKGFDPKKYIELDPTLSNKYMGEQKNKTAVITFGRFSPPTIGHEKLVNKIKDVASARKADPMVFASHTQDKKKNPLSYDDKTHFLQIAFGSIVKKTSARTIIEVAKELSGKYDELVVVVGSDRVPEFQKLLDTYNGKEYNFKNIEVVSAGERDPDADDVSGMSASKLRAVAAAKDFETFKKGLPSKLKPHAKDVYETVLKGMKLMEDLEEESLEEKVSPLNFSQRLKRSMVMKRYHGKIEAARKRAMNRRASPEKLRDRARKKALALLRAKLSQSKSYSDMSASEKIQLDQRLSRIPSEVINKIATKQLPVVKKAEMERFAARSRNEETDVNSQFEMFLENFIQEFSVNEDYYAGLSKSTVAKRKAHFNRGAAMDDDNPDAYKPAPGDARAKTKPSVHTRKFHKIFTKEGRVKHDMHFKMYRPKKNIFESVEEYQEELFDLIESVENIFESQEEGLKNKAEKTGISYGILKKVYDRGVAAWRTGHRPGTTPSQWGMARVNSFATGGKTRHTTDSDLWARHKKNESMEFFTIEEQNELSLLDESSIMDKAINAIHRHVKAGEDLKDVVWALSRLSGVDIPVHKLYDKYIEIYGNPSRKINHTTDPNKLRAKYGFKTEGQAMDMARASIAREKQADAEKHKNMLDNARKVDAKRRSLRTESSEVIKKIIEREKKHREIGKALKDFSDIAQKIDNYDHIYHAAKIVKSHNIAMNAEDLVKLYNRIKTAKDYEKSYSVFDAWESFNIDKSKPSNREYGTDSLVKILKSDTPGEKLDKKFENFLEAKSRGFEGKMVDVPNVPVRMADGKLKKFPSGKSSSSDGGNGD
jgi:nicotinic acid mononucleotide adenylyltransferase